MAIARELPEVEPFFMQNCPVCGRSNRMVVRGVYAKDGKTELYPDIGYSFCNCKSIFYTRYENVTIKTHIGLEHYENPYKEMVNIFGATPSGNVLKFNMPDPFFCEWDNNPYTFEHWNPRFNHILFDMTQLCEDLEEVGFEIVYAKREFDVDSKMQKTMEICIRKP